MERKLSVHIYFIALILSALVFAAGVAIGNYLDDYNRAKISDDISKTHERLASVQILSLMEDNSSAYCPLYLSNLHEIDTEVEDTGYKLTFLENVKMVRDDELKKKYFVLEGESYLLSKKAKQLCNDSSVLVINFYTNNNCPDCVALGNNIISARDALSSQNVSLRLFSFDGTIGSPIADSLKNQYNISTYPSLVINEKVYSGPIDSDHIKSLVRDSR